MPEIPLEITTSAQIEAQVDIAVKSGRTRGYLTHATRMSVGEWLAVNGALVDVDEYPPSIRVSMTVSSDGASSVPQIVVPQEAWIDTDARWIPSQGWDGVTWRPFGPSSRSSGFGLISGGFESGDRPGEDSLIAPEFIPSGEMWFRDAQALPGESPWFTTDVMLFSGGSTMSTRTPRWSSETGLGAFMVCSVDDVSPDGWTHLIGFTTPDPGELFGLQVVARSTGTIALLLSDTDGTRPILTLPLRTPLDIPVLIGLFYDAAAGRAGVVVRGVHDGGVWSTSLPRISGRPGVETMMSMDLSLFQSFNEDRAAVMDVCMWLGLPTPNEMESMINAYASLYGVGHGRDA